MSRLLNLTRCMLLASAVVLIGSCRTVPISGRSQFIFSSDSNEQALGLQAYKEYKAKYKRSSNAAYNAALSRCGRALTAVVPNEDGYEWEFLVFESREQNAFCLPGGKIAVYSGIMDLMRNEAELAFVVAHEIAHAIARHYGERQSWTNMMELGGAVLAAGTDTSADLYSSMSKYGVLLPFSRSNEYEADKIGMILMAKAGYDPSAAIQFWSRFSDGNQEGTLSDLMSTHPRDAARIEAMRAVLPAAQAEYARCAARRGTGASF